MASSNFECASVSKTKSESVQEFIWRCTSRLHSRDSVSGCSRNNNSWHLPVLLISYGLTNWEGHLAFGQRASGRRFRIGLPVYCPNKLSILWVQTKLRGNGKRGQEKNTTVRINHSYTGFQFLLGFSWHLQQSIVSNIYVRWANFVNCPYYTKHITKAHNNKINNLRSYSNRSTAVWFERVLWMDLHSSCALPSWQFQISDVATPLLGGLSLSAFISFHHRPIQHQEWMITSNCRSRK